MFIYIYYYRQNYLFSKIEFLNSIIQSNCYSNVYHIQCILIYYYLIIKVIIKCLNFYNNKIGVESFYKISKDLVLLIKSFDQVYLKF